MHSLPLELAWVEDIPLPEGWRWVYVAQEPAAIHEKATHHSWVTYQGGGQWAVRYYPSNIEYYPFGKYVMCTEEEACNLLAKAIWLDLAYDTLD